MNVIADRSESTTRHTRTDFSARKPGKTRPYRKSPAKLASVSAVITMCAG